MPPIHSRRRKKIQVYKDLPAVLVDWIADREMVIAGFARFVAKVGFV